MQVNTARSTLINTDAKVTALIWAVGLFVVYCGRLMVVV
jgi:hypothetical protein